jgi:hypothetical protein
MTRAPARGRGRQSDFGSLGRQPDSTATLRSIGALRRLPPGGRRLRNLRQRGQVPSSGEVCIGVNDWHLVRHTREDALVLPPNEEPDSFNWRGVAGLPVLLVVYESDLPIADKLAREVIGARCLGCVCLIVPAFGERIGWKVYKSLRESEARHAA